MNWAILGQGVIANQMAKIMREYGYEIYAVAGRHMEKVKDFQNVYQVKHAYTIQQMMEDKNIDIVYIATPHSNHYEYIIEALENGKHVLCEKAITTNAIQLKKARELAEDKGLILMEAMTIFHMPLIQELRNLISNGKLGKVKMIQASFGSLKEYDVKNRFFNKELAGGALLDIGTYALSAIYCFLDEKPDVIHTDWTPFESGVDEMSGTVLKTKGGQMATMTLAMRSKLPKKVVVAAEKGYVEIENYPRADKAKIVWSANGQEEWIEKGESQKALLYEIRDMEETIQTGINKTLQMSCDVTDLLWEIRRQWEMFYPFDEQK